MRAKFLQGFGFLRITLFLYRSQHLIEHIDGQLHHMGAVDHFNRLAKELFDGRGVRLGHIHHHFNPLEFGLRTAREPREDLLGTSPLKRRNRSTL